MDLCRISSLMVSGFFPFIAIWLPYVCLKSWNRQLCKPALSAYSLNFCEIQVTVLNRNGVDWPFLLTLHLSIMDLACLLIGILVSDLFFCLDDIRKKPFGLSTSTNVSRIISPDLRAVYAENSQKSANSRSSIAPNSARNSSMVKNLSCSSSSSGLGNLIGFLMYSHS